MLNIMDVLTIAFGILFVVLGIEARLQARIVNGDIVHPGELPYQVSIRFENEHHCGGSIISQNYVVTAAHCFRRNGVSTIYAGSIDRLNNGSEYQIKQIIKHPLYDKKTKQDDIALVEVTRPFEFSKHLKPVDLPPADMHVIDESDGIISGWGLLRDFSTERPLTLRKAYVTTVNRKKCSKIYEQTILKEQICALGFIGMYGPTPRDACQGDSGGPFVIDRKLIGIISFGRNCGEDTPGVYTRVPSYVEWIHNNTNGDFN